MDLLASEYGWSKNRILFDTYPEEYFVLQRQVKTRKVNEYLMQSAIVANPHKKPEDAQDFIESLLKERSFLVDEEEAPAELDVTSFEKLRKHVTEKSKFMRAK